MSKTGYTRVSKKRPCTICGKPDWCSTTVTETISFCARSTLNADRISRHGWGVYYDSYSALNLNPTFYCISKPRRSEAQKIPASPATRDRVYRKLIELSPAFTNYEIMNGRGGLRDRGIEDYTQYGSLPRTVYARTVLVERLVKAVTKEHGSEIASLIGIPGFWKDANNETRLWSKFDSNDELMLIPFIGRDGLIRACQVRFMRYVQDKSGHYVWLSSAKERMGCSPGSPLHYADSCSQSNKPVLVTEGALKAATAQKFMTDKYVVGNSGVATAHREIVKTARGRPLEIAFDNDSFINPHVARALSALARLRLSDQISFGYSEDIRVVTWDKSIKGLDDALLNRTPLKYLTVAEWLKYLTPECREQAGRELSNCVNNKQAAGGKYDEPA